MWVNIEIKNDPNEPDFDSDRLDRRSHDRSALRERGEDERWLISSFRIETIDRCRALAPTIRTAWLVVGGARRRDRARWSAEVTRRCTRGSGRCCRSHIDVCHGAGIAVNTWTCDDPDRMAELIEWGIDGICTNVPDVALEVISQTVDASDGR